MASDAALFAVGPHDHSQCVPTDKTFYAPLQIAASGIDGLTIYGDSVYVRRVCGEGNLNSGLSSMDLKPFEQRLYTLRPAGFYHIIEGIEPFPNLYITLRACHCR